MYLHLQKAAILHRRENFQAQSYTGGQHDQSQNGSFLREVPIFDWCYGGPIGPAYSSGQMTVFPLAG